MGRLDSVDLSQSLDDEEYAERLEAAQKRLEELRLTLGGQLTGEVGPGLAILMEGWDAGGKGGAIRRMVARLDPRHVRYTAFAAPTSDEKRHMYLLRFASSMPGHGGMAVLDRTWYGRVLVERVEGFASGEEWQRAYGEIRDWERMLVHSGMILIKLFLHISDEEQLHRFQRRKKKRLKAWKLTDEDWRNRGKRPQYEEAIEDMLTETDVPEAPWFVIAGDDKQFARVEIIETVNRVIEDRLGL